MAMMEYRADFLFWAAISVMWSLFNFFFVALILGVGGSIGGWNIYEMYVLLATFTILDAFTWSFFYAIMSAYTESIFSGDFSQLLLKPIDAQVLISIQDNSYSNIFRLLIGVVILIWSLQQLHVKITLTSIALYVILLCTALFFIYSVWFFFSTFAFWVERLDNINEIIPSARRLWQVPRSVYIGSASTLFTVILPLGLVSSVPTEVLIQKSAWQWELYFIAFTFAIFLLGRWFFRYSLRKYSSVGN